MRWWVGHGDGVRADGLQDKQNSGRDTLDDIDNSNIIMVSSIMIHVYIYT